MRTVLPRYLRVRREKIFGPAPEYRLDGNAKTRVWVAAGAYNSANRPTQLGPLFGLSDAWEPVRVRMIRAGTAPARSACNLSSPNRCGSRRSIRQRSP